MSALFSALMRAIPTRMSATTAGREPSTPTHNTATTATTAAIGRTTTFPNARAQRRQARFASRCRPSFARTTHPTTTTMCAMTAGRARNSRVQSSATTVSIAGQGPTRGNPSAASIPTSTTVVHPRCLLGSTTSPTQPSCRRHRQRHRRCRHRRRDRPQRPLLSRHHRLRPHRFRHRRHAPTRPSLRHRHHCRRRPRSRFRLQRHPLSRCQPRFMHIGVRTRALRARGALEKGAWAGGNAPVLKL